MKISDIVEYGVMDEPSYGTSKAAIRAGISGQTNLMKRQNNQIKNDTDETNIKNMQSFYNQKRKQVAATGIPMRLMQPQISTPTREQK